MEYIDALAGTVVLCSAFSDDDDHVRILAEATNRDMPSVDEASEEAMTVWVLIALHPGATKHDVTGVWVEATREPLDALIRARGFARYKLLEIEPGAPFVRANDRRERSICNLYNSVCVSPYTYYQCLLDAKHVTLGDVIDGGAAALSRLGFPKWVIRNVRRRLAAFGLDLVPIKQRRRAG